LFAECFYHPLTSGTFDGISSYVKTDTVKKATAMSKLETPLNEIQPRTAKEKAYKLAIYAA